MENEQGELREEMGWGGKSFVHSARKRICKGIEARGNVEGRPMWMEGRVPSRRCRGSWT